MKVAVSVRFCITAPWGYGRAGIGRHIGRYYKMEKHL